MNKMIMKQLRLTILLVILAVTAIVFYRQVFIGNERKFSQSQNQEAETQLTDIEQQGKVAQINQMPVVLGAVAESAVTDIKSTVQPELISGTIIKGPADNGYFRAQAGTYWIYEGQGSDMDDGKNINNYKIKLKNEVISVSGVKDDYLLKTKTTNLIDMSTKEGTITIEKDYVVFDTGSFVNYVKFPLKVGSRWPEGLEDANTEPLRADGFYQNRIDWKLNSKVLGNDCYNIIEQTLPNTNQTIWCNEIGPIQNTYHHNGTLLDESIKLTEYHF